MADMRALQAEFDTSLLSVIVRLSAEIEEYDATLRLTTRRMLRASKLWQRETGNRGVYPDLGELLGWLMQERHDWKQTAADLTESLDMALEGLRDDGPYVVHISRREFMDLPLETRRRVMERCVDNFIAAGGVQNVDATTAGRTQAQAGGEDA